MQDQSLHDSDSKPQKSGAETTSIIGVEGSKKIASLSRSEFTRYDHSFVPGERVRGSFVRFDKMRSKVYALFDLEDGRKTRVDIKYFKFLKGREAMFMPGDKVTMESLVYSSRLHQPSWFILSTPRRFDKEGFTIKYPTTIQQLLAPKDNWNETDSDFEMNAGEIGLDVIPKLVLVYPYSEKFTEYLPEFVYEDIKENIGLKLMVVPFDLTNPSTYERQIHNIIHCLDVKPEIQPIYRYEYDWEESTLPLVAAEPTPHYRQTMLVGCYRSKAHLEWIKQNHLYNIRLGNRIGAASKSGLVVSASRLLLYDSKNPTEYQVLNLDSSNHIIANNDLMKSKNYPDLKPDREYLLYVITEEAGVKPYFDVESLKQTYAPKLKKGSPFFVTI